MRQSTRRQWPFFLALVLWAGVVFAAVYGQGGDMRTWAKSADYTRRAPTRAYFDAAIAECNANGVTAAVEARTSSNQKDAERATLLAMAIYESQCISKPNGKGCVGWYQVCPGKDDAQFRNLTKKYQSTVSDRDGLIRNLSNSPNFATMVAQVDILGYWRHVSPNEIAAFCGFAGFANSKQYDASNLCNSAVHYVLLKGWVMGESYASETIVKLDDPHYGDTIYKDSSGNEVLRTLNCQDRTTKLAQALAQTARAYHVRDAVQTQENFFEGLEAGNSIGSLHEGDLDKFYCFKVGAGAFDIAQALMDGATWLQNWIKNQINAVLDALCNYVVSFVASNVDKLLNSICLPVKLPDFSFNMGSLSSSKTCDGIPLGHALVSSTGAMTADDLLDPFNAKMAREVYPAINSIPSYGGTVNMPMLPMLRFFGTDGAGNEKYH